MRPLQPECKGHIFHSFGASTQFPAFGFGRLETAITTSGLGGLLFRTYPPIRLLGRTMILHRRRQESNLRACRVELRCTLPCTVHLDFLCPRRIGAFGKTRTCNHPLTKRKLYLLSYESIYMSLGERSLSTESNRSLPFGSVPPQD